MYAQVVHKKKYIYIYIYTYIYVYIYMYIYIYSHVVHQWAALFTAICLHGLCIEWLIN